MRVGASEECLAMSTLGEQALASPHALLLPAVQAGSIGGSRSYQMVSFQPLPWGGPSG